MNNNDSISKSPVQWLTPIQAGMVISAIVMNVAQMTGGQDADYIRSCLRKLVDEEPVWLRMKENIAMLVQAQDARPQ